MIDKLDPLLDRLVPNLQKLWNARRRFLYFNMLVILSFTLYLLFIHPSEYLSKVSILPDYGNKPSLMGQLGDIASLAGVDVGNSAPTEIYEMILKSETVMENAFYKKYTTQKYPTQVNLVEYYDLSKRDDLDSSKIERDLFLRLRERFIKNSLKTSVDRFTKVLTIQVTLRESQLSADVVNNLVFSLDEFVREKRKSYAIEQRQYIEKRRHQVSDSLMAAEERLKLFKLSNKSYSSSPELLLESTRLMRTIETNSAVLYELTKQYELAKIEEIKDTPVINVQELARDPIQKEGPRKLLLLAFFIVISLFFSGTYFIYEAEIWKVGFAVKQKIKTIRQS